MRSTYNASGMSQVPENYKEQVYEEMREAIDNGELVCVMLNDFYYSDESYETHLYGAYRASEEWVRQYDNSGGMWSYDCPKKFLTN